MKRQRKIRTVYLELHEDNASAAWGLASPLTLNTPAGRDFNAFWNGIGIFHDVFEHSHEYTHKYFKGDYAMNLAGEMAAMGAYTYFVHELWVRNRPPQSNWHLTDPISQAINTTFGYVQETTHSGYVDFGDTLDTCIPYQRPVEDANLEGLIDEYWEKIQGLTIHTTEPEELAYAKQFLKSLTKRKIADTHRYGWRMAQRLAPSYDCRDTLVDFIDLWTAFCKENNPQKLAYHIRGIEFNLYRCNGGLLDWEATFIGHEREKIKANQKNLLHLELGFL